MSFAAPSEQIDFLSSARSGSYVLFCLFPSSSSPKVDFSAVEKVELGVAANKGITLIFIQGGFGL
jgi:hypothetical protein